MSKPFTLFRIRCTGNQRALVGGSDYPTRDYEPQWGRYPNGQSKWQWWDRGDWARDGGSFWKTEDTVKKHLRNLCHDWTTEVVRHGPYQIGGKIFEYTRRCPIHGTEADWTRLEKLIVERFHITEYTTSLQPARDFMGIQSQAQAEAA